ncbi:MAG TPA: UPF0147 family protein [Nitrososphaerales archaeon]|nr:UPF0147 family protein [Nitrososphaerales archaeon]
MHYSGCHHTRIKHGWLRKALNPIKSSLETQGSLSTSAKLKKQQENEAKLAKAVVSLTQISDSNITPRNIRKIVKDSVLMLQDAKQSVAVRAANAISLLDEVAQDPNMPSFARVTLWSAVSELESIREQ